MAEVKYLADINLNDNQLTNVKLQHLTGDPTAVEGKIFYHSGSNVIKFHNGTAWISLSAATGDITSVVAGVGLSGGATSGAATVTVDFSEFSTVTPANGDFLAALDSDGSTEQKTSVAALATLFAGSGLTATNSVIAVDTLNQNTTGSAATLTTARTIGGVSFNGSANINLPGVNSAGNQNTTGSAATLTTARAIGGVNFNGSAAINLPGVNTAGNQNTSGTAAIATAVTVADESTDTSCNVLFTTAATGDLPPKSGTNLTFNSSSGVLTATGFVGPLTGNVTGNTSGSSGSTTGNAATATLAADATTLATPRAINGVNFDGSAAITVTAAAGTLSGSTLKSSVTASSLTSLGTIGTGVWNGSVIADAYLSANTAHLSGAQTFSGSKTFGTTTKLNFRDANAYINSPTANDIEVAATTITLDAASDIQLEGDTTVTGNFSVSGTLNVDGTTTTIDSTTVAIADSMLKLAKDQANTADAVDFGYYGQYGVEGTAKYAGIFRDVSAAGDPFTFFDSLQAEPGATVNTSGTGYDLADIAAGAIRSEDGFTGALTGNVTGNASTATTLATARTIGGTSFNGSANIAVNLAATATALATARTIGGVSFNGTSNINLPGVNSAGNQNTTGSAATLTTARTIGGVSFNGSANIDLPGVNSAGNQNTSGLAGTATALATARTIGGVSFDGTGNINLPGVNAAGNQSTSGLAATATKLATTRAINGVNFDGTAAITVTAAAGTLTGATLKSTVLNSSLTSVGTIATGVWNATEIGTSKTAAKVTSIVAGAGIDVNNSGVGAVTVTAETASATNPGIVELATTAEALTGTDTTRAVTAAGLAARSYRAAIGNGSATAIAVTHSLGTRDVNVQLYDASSYETVHAQVVRNTTAQVTVTFNVAPTASDVIILINKID